MVKRAVEWLHTGGRILLPASKKHSRSRRHLHSAFWSHGAGNINLPAWWVLFLQNTDPQEPSSDTRHHSPKTALSTGLREIFLDFLYPFHTIALIQRLRQSANAQYHAAQNISNCSRSYTSIAKDFLNGAKGVAIDTRAQTENTSIADTVLPGDAIRRAINEMLDSKDRSWIYDQLWQSYQDLLQIPQSLSPEELVKMLHCLGTSSRTIDLERAVALFESISVQQRRAIHYRYAIQAALSLHNLDTAIKLHREAVARIHGSIGTAAVLRYTVQHGEWSSAVGTWYPYWGDRLRHYTTLDIWEGVRSLPLTDLIERAISAAEFATRTANKWQVERAMAARDFALELIKLTFRIHKTDFDHLRHRRLTMKLRALDAVNMELPTMAVQQLLSVNTREHRQEALYLYAILRKEQNFVPSQNLLSSLANKLGELKSSLAMQMIIKDWRRYYQKVPAHVAISVAKVFAQLGELEMLQDLFDSFRSTYGVPSTTAWYHLLLFVHNRRTDTAGVVRSFNQLQEEFQFKPTLQAWTYVIGTFSRNGDVDGALTWFDNLLESGLRPDARVYTLLMAMFARRGDWDAVQDLFLKSKINNIRTTTTMYNCIVVAKINDGRLTEAERLVKDALKMDLEGSRTFMWTVVLNAYALRNEVEKVSVLHKEMRESGIASDGMTYAALMTSLTVARMPLAARKILNRVLPGAKIQRTALHYAIVMYGFLWKHDFPNLFDVYRDMVHRKISPTTSIHTALIRAQAILRKTRRRREFYITARTMAGVRITLRHSRKAVEQSISKLDPKQLAASEPRMFVGPELVNEAFASTQFDYLIYLQGRDTLFPRINELYESYIETDARVGNRATRDIEAIPPVRLLSALMACHVRAGNHGEVERCWNLGLEKSKVLARQHNSSTSEPGWVLFSRRYILNLPLRQYLTSLNQQGRIVDEISLVDQLGTFGFALNSANWNKYIQDLAQSREPRHQLLAFEHCERELMPSWPGWELFGNPTYIKDRYPSMTKETLKLKKRQTPAYLTLILLAAVYLQARQGTRLIRTEQLAEAAPITVDTVIGMPRMADGLQMTYLRGGQ